MKQADDESSDNVKTQTVNDEHQTSDDGKESKDKEQKGNISRSRIITITNTSLHMTVATLTLALS